jgi:phage gp29-like protein
MNAGSKVARLRASERGGELLGAYQAYLATSYRLPPFSDDALLAQKGYAAVEDQLSLSCVRAPFDIIRDAVLTKGWSWEPAFNDTVRDGQRAEKAREIAEALTFDCLNIVDDADNCQDLRQVVRELLVAVHTGFHVTEICWRLHESGPNAGRWGFRCFASKPARQIGFDLDRRTLALNAITSYTPLTGYQFDIPPEKCLLYTYSPKDSLPHGNGLGRVCYKHGWSFDFSLKFLNVAIETFAVPFLLAKAPKASLALVRDVLNQVRQGAPPVLPADADAELVELSGGGIASILSAVEMHRQACAMVYLHNTLTSGVGSEGGNRALGQVHQDTQQYGLDAIRTDVEMVMTHQLARRWMRYNFGPESMEFCPRFSLGQWDTGDRASLATTFETLVRMGTMHPDEPVIRRSLGLPPRE